MFSLRWVVFVVGFCVTFSSGTLSELMECVEMKRDE